MAAQPGIMTKFLQHVKIRAPNARTKNKELFAMLLLHRRAVRLCQAAVGFLKNLKSSDFLKKIVSRKSKFGSQNERKIGIRPASRAKIVNSAIVGIDTAGSKNFKVWTTRPQNSILWVEQN